MLMEGTMLILRQPTHAMMGYSLGPSGWLTRTCQNSGKWNGSPKYCYRKYFSISISLSISVVIVMFNKIIIH